MRRGPGRPRRLAAPAAALLAALLLAGCAAAPADRADPKAVRDHAMKAYAVHEECLRIAVGERLEYYFMSTQPVDFNLHYHEGRAVAMPVVRERSREDSGVFVANVAQDYCLMWEAGPAGAVLDYRFRLRLPTARQ